MKSYILLGLALWSAHLSLAQNSRRSAEVFVQIEDRGTFTVYLGNEFVGSATGKFRFYDVYETSPTISILQGNRKIYSQKVDLRNDQRTILSFSVRGGMRMAKTLNIYRNNQYALDSFDAYVGAYNTGVVPPKNSSDDAFQNLVTLVKKKSFDDDKIKLINAYAVHSALETSQILMLLKTFSNDDKKLTVARSLSRSTIDPQNYYTLVDAFAFMSTKDAFLNDLNTTVQRPGREMRNQVYEELKASVKKESFDDSKTKLIQVALQNSSINTLQLGELLKLYTFEGKALDCAQLVYNAVYDKNRFFTLREVFKFKTNQDALLDFLERK